jgi:hypothetical protein
MNLSADETFPLEFVDALKYAGDSQMADVNILHFNEAMQYLSLPDDSTHTVSRDDFIAAVQRCSLVHALYEVIALGDNYDNLAELAIEDGGFQDMYEGGTNAKSTWCFRLRNYGDLGRSDKERRYGSRARSLICEREAGQALKELLIRFGGKVNLDEPDCKVVVFDGLRGTEKVLTRTISVGPRVR